MHERCLGLFFFSWFCFSCFPLDSTGFTRTINWTMYDHTTLTHTSGVSIDSIRFFRSRYRDNPPADTRVGVGSGPAVIPAGANPSEIQ